MLTGPTSKELQLRNHRQKGVVGYIGCIPFEPACPFLPTMMGSCTERPSGAESEPRPPDLNGPMVDRSISVCWSDR